MDVNRSKPQISFYVAVVIFVACNKFVLLLFWLFISIIYLNLMLYSVLFIPVSCGNDLTALCTCSSSAPHTAEGKLCGNTLLCH